MLSCPTSQAFQLIERSILDIFTSEPFLSECRRLQGEASCLICLRKENYVWWLSVGDCMLFLSHAELARWGQAMLNQRNFYEWIGRVNTFELSVPCYSSGRRQLRSGTSEIIMITDGFLDTGYGLNGIADVLQGRINMNKFFEMLHNESTVDSTTMIYWSVVNPKSAAIPSN
ncbi:protein phosphatase 2C domain-containing protein [Paenibacillus chartarius]|uniref:Protein phosphatase 2C domain-containing protein n=1 Tax=Paenibacillus chartarius TaxID=747481 RepID=A0ABV6DR32_9BACL